MKNNTIVEILLALGMIVLSFLALNPVNWWMSSMTVGTILFSILGLFAAYTVLIWREKAHDERETYHQLYAGRVTSIAVTLVLIIGICLEGWSHHVDPWLVGGLAVIVMGKIATRAYGEWML